MPTRATAGSVPDVFLPESQLGAGLTNPEYALTCPAETMAKPP